MTNRELINYVETHSQTERALMHSDMINKMLELAGEAQRVPDGWFAWHYEDAKRYVEAARAANKGAT